MKITVDRENTILMSGHFKEYSTFFDEHKKLKIRVEKG